jgi:hypothetical protein
MIKNPKTLVSPIISQGQGVVHVTGVVKRDINVGTVQLKM